MNKPAITKFLTSCTRLKYEAQYWTGYDHNLVEQVSKEANELEGKIDDLYKDLVRERSGNRAGIIKFAISLICIALVVSFCVYAGTHWRNAEKAARSAFIKEFNETKEFERLGFQKLIIGDSGYTGYELYVKRITQ